MLIDVEKDKDYNLDIGNSDYSDRLNFLNTFENTYVYAIRPHSLKIDFCANIRLESDKAQFCYRPRRLSYSDKKEVKKIINDLVKGELSERVFLLIHHPLF